MPRGAPPILTLEDVTFTYDGAAAPAVRGLTLAVGEGERLAVVGPGGSGKSTFCRLVRGALTASAAAGDGWLDGRIRLRGVDAGEAAYTAIDAAGRIGAVTQDPETGLAMDVVEDEIAFGPENLCVPAAELDALVDASLAAVGLTPALRPARTSELSGGQQQRVATAAALAMEPALLVLDDAAANLDAPGAALLRETLRDLHRRGATLIESSPRWDGAADADRVAVLDGGRLLAVGAPADVLAAHGDALRRLGLLPAGPGPSPAPAASPGAALLEARELRYAYPRAASPVLRGVTAEVRVGDVVALVGPNGSGKTTFGKLIAGLLPAPPGALLLRGKPLAAYGLQELARAVGYVFQRPERQFVADTALEEVAFGLRAARGARAPHPDDTERAVACLETFGLADRRDVHPRSLPVAEQRLLNLAAALVLSPAIVVLDEPTAGLDYAATDRLLAHVAAFAARGGAALVITHDEYVVRRWTTRVLAFG
jgi:energy-coupling factor transport system ATP-binding protein